MPFYTMPPGGDQKQARAYIPVDDENCVKWQIKWFPSKRIKDASKKLCAAPSAKKRTKRRQIHCRSAISA